MQITHRQSGATDFVACKVQGRHTGSFSDGHRMDVPTIDLARSSPEPIYRSWIWLEAVDSTLPPLCKDRRNGLAYMRPHVDHPVDARSAEQPSTVGFWSSAVPAYPEIGRSKYALQRNKARVLECGHEIGSGRNTRIAVIAYSTR